MDGLVVEEVETLILVLGMVDMLMVVMVYLEVVGSGGLMEEVSIQGVKQLMELVEEVEVCRRSN